MAAARGWLLGSSPWGWGEEAGKNLGWNWRGMKLDLEGNVGALPHGTGLEVRRKVQRMEQKI